MKSAGYEVKRRIPKIGDMISFKKSIGDIAVGDKGTIIGIEPERPYSYMVKVKDMEIFTKLDDFEKQDRAGAKIKPISRRYQDIVNSIFYLFRYSVLFVLVIK